MPLPASQIHCPVPQWRFVRVELTVTLPPTCRLAGLRQKENDELEMAKTICPATEPGFPGMRTVPSIREKQSGARWRGRSCS